MAASRAAPWTHVPKPPFPKHWRILRHAGTTYLGTGKSFDAAGRVGVVFYAIRRLKTAWNYER